MIKLAILKNTKYRKKSCEFLPRPIAKCTTWHFSVTSPCSFFTFYKKKTGAQNLTFCGFGTSGNAFLHILSLFKQHLALTMATAMCVCVSQQPAESIKIQGRCTFLASLLQWVENSRCLRYRHVQLPNGEKGYQFESNSANPTLDTRKRIDRCLQG